MIDQETNSVRDYTDIAATYDKKRFEDLDGQFNYDIDCEIIREFVEQSGAKRCLDAPVGTGRVLSYLEDMDVHVVGCDATESMLEGAATRAHAEKHTLQLADASDLPFESGEFDCVITLRFFHLFAKEERLKFAAEFDRVLKPGGFVICSFTNGWYAGGINWLKRLLGFRTVYFQYPGELKKLFPGYRVCRLRGNFLPLQSKISRTTKFGGRCLAALTRAFPVNLVCWERFYLLQKGE